MERSKNLYEEWGGNRIVPESPFEVDVVRQAILADKWDLSPEQRAARGDGWPLSCRRGGQAVFHPEWSPDFVVHYQVGGHLDDGFFDLKVELHGKGVSASFHLLAALVFAGHPPFQVGWEGTARKHFLCPSWFLAAERADPKGLQLQAGQNRGGLMWTSLSRESGEWDCLPPHVVLVDPSSITGHETR